MYVYMNIDRSSCHYDSCLKIDKTKDERLNIFLINENSLKNIVFKIRIVWLILL